MESSHKHSNNDACCSDHNEIQEVPQQIIKDIFFASNVGDINLLKTLIEQDKIDINSRDNDGSTALHWACYKNRLEVAKYLVEHGAELDVANISEGHTALMWACVGGHLQCIHYLLEQGANVYKVDNRGYNALHHAIQNSHSLVAHFLLGKGVFVDSKDNEGHTR